MTTSDTSSFSAPGVEEVLGSRRARVDLSGEWPTVEDLLGGGPAPVWDVAAPLHHAIELTVVLPDDEVVVPALTIRPLVLDERLATLFASHPYEDAEKAADDARAIGTRLGLPEAELGGIADRIATRRPDQRDREVVNGTDAAGVRASLEAIWMPPRGKAPALVVLEWTITPAGTGHAVDASETLEEPSDGPEA